MAFLGKGAGRGRHKHKKVDQLAALRMDERRVQKDQQYLQERFLQEDAEKLKDVLFQGDEADWSDEEVGDLAIAQTQVQRDVEKIRERKVAEAKAAKEARQKEMADAKAKHQLRNICRDIIDMIKGRQVTETELIMDSHTMRTTKVLDVDIDISWDDRSRACEALWAFQFKGEAHKEVAVELGAVELLVDFLARPPEPGTVPAKDRFAVNAMAHHSLVCLRSLASHEPNVQHMVYAGVPEQMVKEVKSASEDHKVLALECLCCLAKHDKSTRIFLTGPKSRLLVKILGDKKAGQQNFHRLVKSGVETVAMAALHMVEVLLTRDEHRLFVLNETFVISVMRSVMDSRNQGAQAMVCRVVMRLCQSEECRNIMQKLGVTDFAADFFCSAFSAENRAMACAALGSLVASKDESLAEKCLPRVWEILTVPSRTSSEEERALMELPGAMRCLRAFCKMRWVQDSVVSRGYLEDLIGHIAHENASHVTRAEAAHVLGSVALQTKHHKTIMTSIVPPCGPLLKLVFEGDQIEKFSAARAVQNLTFYSRYCELFANFKSVKSHWDDKLQRDVITRWNALQAVTNLLLPAQALNCKTHGAGMLRNFASIDSIRDKMMRHFEKNVPNCAVMLLIDVLNSGNPLAARAHAAAALGNLCSTEQYAHILVTVGSGKAVRDVANILFAEAKTQQDKQFHVESKVSAITTLCLMVCNEECCRIVLDTGALVRLGPCLSSREPSHLRIAAAKCLHNVTSFYTGSKAVADGTGLLEAILKTCKTDNQGLQENLVACIANLSSFPNFIDHLMSGRSCATIVYLLKKGKGASKRLAAQVCKNVSRSQQAVYCKPFVEAHALRALVNLLDHEKEVEDGCAEMAVLALARFAASDTDITTKMVDSKGFDSMLQLLANGCPSARVTVAKTLLYFADNKDFAKLMVQAGGIGCVHKCMGERDDSFELAGMLLTIFTDNSKKEDLGMSKVDRKLAKKNAATRAQVAEIRYRRDDPANRTKTPNVFKFMHRPRPTTAPDRRDLHSSGSTFEPGDHFDDADDDGIMNGNGIPALLPPISASTDAMRPTTGVRFATGTARAGILMRGGARSPDTDAGRASTAASRRVTFGQIDDHDESDSSDSEAEREREKERARERMRGGSLPMIRSRAQMF